MAKIALDLIEPVRVQSVSDHVAERLERLILDGLLSPGDQLPSEAELASALHVGRSTVREAKQILMTKGLLIARGRAGAFVADPTASGEFDAVLRALRDPSHEEVHEVRRIVELAACQLAAESVTRREIKRMRSNLEHIESQAKTNAALPWPRFLEIHFLIVQASRNRLLSSIYELIMQVLKRNQVPFLPFIADWQEEVEEHRHLIDVLERGDPEAMADEMARHLEHSEKYRTDLLEYQARNGSIVRSDR
ncbi:MULTISPECIES: GntR family transcriptional regulator [unclassified Mesorhizobium]|uniref:FadR/GntR family transcriptional regulator n=1 Tax=unclassified Mesorhizobium TaxID=325217 RepID=UPI000FDA6FD9|nr:MULTISPECIES: GntR family transcriptional regulator [unclassified Mesorhizobium]TGT71894.1 FadR family transcriptional regulator [Mesorhizobium sp. M2E.F.Ca.ET.166.01.1.1]TGV99391.1 FadR family transcriptional regulator [Mesorhizobium sp. M2E.F.Ca.ET.154.01.1.1]